MSEWILYQNKPLGRIKIHESISKIIFIAENLECLEQLFRLNDIDEIESGVRGKMSYRQFREDSLSKLSAFYPTLEDWMLKSQAGRTIDEFERYNEARRKLELKG